MDSNITTTKTLTSSIVPRGGRYDALRDLNGEILRDLNGNPLMAVTITYRSVITDDSFITVTT